MDPLSITASIVTLLTLAGKTGTFLSTFCSRFQGAARFISMAIGEVSSIEKPVDYLNNFASGEASIPPSRASILQLDYVIAAITDAVLLFSELEKLLLPSRDLNFNIKNLSHRICSVIQSQQLERLLTHLQWQKLTLATIINVIAW